MDGWIRLPTVLRNIRVAELDARRFRMPFLRASDVAYRGHAPASLARSGAGVVWGGLLRGHAYARNQRTPTPATTWDRQLPRSVASSASTAPGHDQRRPHASVRVDRDGRNAYRWTLERQDG